MATQIITLNTQGLQTALHRETLIQWLNCFQPEIVCLQETHATSIGEFSGWFDDTNYQCISSAGTNRSSGVGILIHTSFSIEHHWRDTTGRYICVELLKQNYAFRLHCLYGPNNSISGCNFFGSLLPYTDAMIPNIYCGDFNTVLDPVADRRGCNPNSIWSYNCPPSLVALMEAMQNRDTLGTAPVVRRAPELT